VTCKGPLAAPHSGSGRPQHQAELLGILPLMLLSTDAAPLGCQSEGSAIPPLDSSQVLAAPEALALVAGALDAANPAIGGSAQRQTPCPCPLPLPLPPPSLAPCPTSTAAIRADHHRAAAGLGALGRLRTSSRMILRAACSGPLLWNRWIGWQVNHPGLKWLCSCRQRFGGTRKLCCCGCCCCCCCYSSRSWPVLLGLQEVAARPGPSLAEPCCLQLCTYGGPWRCVGQMC